MKIKRVKLVDEVADTLREAILKGRFQPGERLLQEKLATDLGVSRTPLREALIKLKTEGLVSVSKRSGVVVTKLDFNEALDLYDLREVLDGLAARLAASRVSASEAAQLKRLLEKMARGSEKPDMHEWLVMNLRMHETIARASQNKSLARLLPVITMSSQMFFPTLLVHPERIRVTLEEHREICEAIFRGDEERAETLAREHIKKVKQLIIQEAQRRAKDGVEPAMLGAKA